MASVDAKTGAAIALAASFAAVIESKPDEIRRSISSSMTIELSTSRPRARAIPPKVIELSP